MKTIKFLAMSVILVAAIILALLYEGDTPKDVVDAKYSNPSSQFTTFEDKATIHYRDEGNRKGETIILIHGFAASLHTWSPWVGLLEDEYCIITLDLPGHGLTGTVPSADYSVEGDVRTVDRLADHLSLSSFVLGGSSMGGGVTWRYALEHPTKVKAMILVNAAGPPAWSDFDGDDRRPAVFMLLTKPWFRSIAVKLDPYYLLAQALRSAYNYSSVATDDLIMRYYHLLLRQGSRKAVIDRFAASQASAQPADLQSLNQPTLLLWGREDSIVDVQVANRFDEVLPVSSLIIYEDVGHIPMEEIPERAARDVRTFLHSLDED